MSNLNRIIIPIVKNKPTPEELNVFQSTTLCLTPQKDPPLSKILVDKKYTSAFKRYKQKKQKREQNFEETLRAQPALPLRNKKKPLKLKVQQMDQLTINKKIQQLNYFSVKFGFYDPNEAPLYASDSSSTIDIPRSIPLILEKTRKNEEEIQVQLQQKLKIEPIEQENEIKYVEMIYQDDDPFIIIKKTDNKKLRKPIEKKKKPNILPLCYSSLRQEVSTPKNQFNQHWSSDKFTKQKPQKGLQKSKIKGEERKKQKMEKKILSLSTSDPEYKMEVELEVQIQSKLDNVLSQIPALPISADVIG